MTTCPYCSWPDSEPVDVLSEHRTAEGLIVWTRCPCGSLQVRLAAASGVRLLSRGFPHAVAVQGHGDPGPGPETAASGHRRC
jgi:hypothetical protein